MGSSTAAGPHVERAVGMAAVGPSVLARAGLTRVDYADYFAIGHVGGATVTPERWSRAMFGDLPNVGERFIWQGLLQLRLAPGRSRATVAGWRIGARGEDWIRLEADSWALAANLIVRDDGSTVSLATLIRYDRRFAAVAWGVLSAVHRRLTPGILRDAAIAVTGSSADRPRRRSAP